MPKPTISSLQTQLGNCQGRLAIAEYELKAKGSLLVALRNSLAKSPFSFLLPKFVKNWVFEERKALAKQFGAE